jgi:hypothetical protein
VPGHCIACIPPATRGIEISIRIAPGATGTNSSRHPCLGFRFRAPTSTSPRMQCHASKRKATCKAFIEPLFLVFVLSSGRGSPPSRSSILRPRQQHGGLYFVPSTKYMPGDQTGEVRTGRGDQRAAWCQETCPETCCHEHFGVAWRKNKRFHGRLLGCWWY